MVGKIYLFLLIQYITHFVLHRGTLILFSTAASLCLPSKDKNSNILYFSVYNQKRKKSMVY